MSIEVIPQAAALGAEIRGVDLSKPLSNSVFSDINDAFLAHQVVFFRDQKITPDEYAAFARRFGPLISYMFSEGVSEAHPEITPIVKTETSTESFGSYWHSDSTYLEKPPKATFLYAREVPERGGDTLFADMYGVYEQLSPGLKTLLTPLNAVYSAGLFERDEDTYEGMHGKGKEHRFTQAIHPVIRTHDETGRQALYVNETHTLELEGMTRDESLAILEPLYVLTKRPEFSFRLRWEPDTLTIWDNRCTQHYALDDYDGQRRVMHRIIAEGGLPH